jgi:hypothetical protein
MKKFAFLLVAAFCVPVLGVTGCDSGGGESKVVEAQPEEPEMSEADQAEFDAAMDADGQQG